MRLTIDETAYNKFRTNLNKMAEFVALSEATDERYKARQEAIENLWNKFEEKYFSRVNNIHAIFKDFEAIMTEVGAKRLDLTHKKVLQSGEAQLQQMQQMTTECLKKIQSIYKKLETLSQCAVKNITQATQSVKAEDFQHVASASVTQIKQTCTASFKKIDSIVRWFHWRNIGFALSITLSVTITIGLYINDEMPWTSHQRVMRERNLAKAVTFVWPRLSKTDRQEILQSASKMLT